jgi:hypothetical protein
MKTQPEVEEAMQLLVETAQRASRDGDLDSYEVAANLGSALCWISGKKTPLTASIDQLLQLARLERRADPVIGLDL